MTAEARPLIVFDCDSTLSSIEGVDELARVHGPERFEDVERMTHEAMDGKIPVEAIFGRRLEVIRPSAADVGLVGQRYIETVEPTAVATLETLRERGWDVAILSGGFRPAILPLADFLGINRVEAVELYFDAEGNYTGYDETYPTTRSGGKPEVIRRLKTELAPSRVVMVGDGVSDLETAPEVDCFIGYGGVVARAKVESEARFFIRRLEELLPLVDNV